jgi:hypothetical protein
MKKNESVRSFHESKQVIENLRAQLEEAEKGEKILKDQTNNLN